MSEEQKITVENVQEQPQEREEDVETIIIPNGKEFKEFLYDKEFERKSGEVEIPARILDLLTSFLDSSLKPDYVWNQPPFRKLFNDGSYWQVVKLKFYVPTTYGTQTFDMPWHGVCVIAETIRDSAKVCLIDDRVYVKAGDAKFWSNYVTTRVVLKSRRRQQKLELFDIVRKILIYNYYFLDC